MKSELDELYLGWTPSQMIEITLNHPDDFLKVKETLSRIGVASTREFNTLYQSCHIFHKQGRYYIAHFKEMFMIDGRPSDFTVGDFMRRNTIAQLLSDWGLVNIVTPLLPEACATMRNIKVIAHKDRNTWTLLAKYCIGNTKGCSRYTSAR